MGGDSCLLFPPGNTAEGRRKVLIIPILFIPILIIPVLIIPVLIFTPITLILVPPGRTILSLPRHSRDPVSHADGAAPPAVPAFLTVRVTLRARSSWSPSSPPCLISALSRSLSRASLSRICSHSLLLPGSAGKW